MELLTNASGYAQLLERDNRFVITCLYNGEKVKAHLPNPGRLWELFFPGVQVILQENRSKTAKLKYTCMAVLKNKRPVFLHTHLANKIAQHLLTSSLIPSLASARVVRSEVKYENSRFDFLLEDTEGLIYVEVKSCSLFQGHFAMFPDAPTQRGTKHVTELAHLAGQGKRCAVLFITQDPGVRYFLPEYHTDPHFARALYEAREELMIVPISFSLDNDLKLLPHINELQVPWQVYEKARNDSGAYMVVLYLEEDKTITIGSRLNIFFRKGYYVYAGSAKKNLTSRIQRHSRLRKKLHWHIDYLRQHTRFVTALPIRTPLDIECDLARRLSAVSGWAVDHFGCSDCACQSHLFGFTSNPFDLYGFVDLLLYFRMDQQEQFL